METIVRIIKELTELRSSAKPEDPKASLEGFINCTRKYLSLLLIWIHGINLCFLIEVKVQISEE